MKEDFISLMEKYFDSHCHVFIRKETLNLHFIYQVLYVLPHLLKDTRKYTLFEDLRERGLKIKHFVNFMRAGMHKSSEDVYEHMQTVYKHNFNIVPLMFDLEYAFVGTRQDAEVAHKAMLKTFRDHFDEHATSFNEGNKKFIGDALQEIKSGKHKDNSKEHLAEINDLHQHMTNAEDLLKEINNKNYEPSGTKKNNFEIQLEDLYELKAKHPITVFPFFAIDPRRPGIIDRFINDIYPSGVFSGVKLYTPNGYSPLDDDLMDPVNGLYAFCSDKNIPITAHCAYEGFATPLEKVEIFGYYYKKSDQNPETGEIVPVHGDINLSKMFTRGWVGERADKLNHPDLWEKVLQKFPKLKLNLAHFGYPNPVWNDRIFVLMQKHPNLYTDLSCWTDIRLLKEFKTKYFLKASDDVKRRIMYGSDFYLDLIFISSLEEYFKSFTQIFTSEEFNLIARDNAKEFLFGEAMTIKTQNKLQKFFSKLFRIHHKKAGK